MRPALLRMAIRYLENSDEAEDAVQDALLKLWFLRDRLDQYRSVDALAIVITKHLCIQPSARHSDRESRFGAGHQHWWR